MCERIPALPSPVAGLDRRVVLAGLGSLLLGTCMPLPQGAWPARADGPATLPPSPAPPQRPAVPAAKPLQYVARAAWGAQPLRDNHDPMPRVSRITLHHTAEIEGATQRTDAELVRGVQDFHQQERGWADIGYHWVLGRDGRVYEGRSLRVQGAHAGGGNNVENLGISVIGEFSHALPGPVQLETLERFLVAQMRSHALPWAELRGHRDFKPTECPGSALYAWLERFKLSRSA